MNTPLAYPWRQLRLSRGWEPLDVVGRMKFAASRQGFLLPPAWLLLQWVFLWENRRAELPVFYFGLLSHVFGNTVHGGPRAVCK